MFDASFYGWYNADGLQMAKVDDPSVPADLPLYLYFVPAAGGNPANVKANVDTAFWDSSSPYSQSARVTVATVAVLGRPESAEAWAANFFLVKPVPGTGTIDASQASGNVFIIVNDSVQTVKLGDGPTAVIGWNSNTAPKTFVLNPIPVVGSFNRPFLGITPGDTIDAREVTGDPVWLIDNREQVTFDNKAAAGGVYRPFTAFSRYLAKDAFGYRIAEFAVMLQDKQVVADPAAVVRGAMVVPPSVATPSAGIAPLLHHPSADYGVKGVMRNLTEHDVRVKFGFDQYRTLAPGEEVAFSSGETALFQFNRPGSSHAAEFQITDYVASDPRTPSTRFRADVNDTRSDVMNWIWRENQSRIESFGGTKLRVKREIDGFNGGYETGGSSDWAVFTVEILGVAGTALDPLSGTTNLDNPFYEGRDTSLFDQAK